MDANASNAGLALMALLSRHTLRCTPRQAIAELVNMRGAEKWYRKRLRSVEKHLEACEFHGRPLLDEPMSMAALDAVLKEAWLTINSPEYRSREFEQVVQDAQRLTH